MTARPAGDHPAADPPVLRARLRGGETLTGLVVRTPDHQVVEVLAASAAPPDVVMIDREHASFGDDALDACLAVAVARGLPALVRVPALDRPALQAPLDAGATGVVVPHVRSGADAARAVRLAHYGDGGRGYSGSTRSAGWGTRPMAEVLAAAAERTTVVVQIEDPDALDAADAIAATPGVDAVFVGAADLAVALGASSPTAPTVIEAVTRVVGACRRAGTAVMAYAGNAADEAAWRDRGATCVLVGSDQGRIGRMV